MSATLSRMTSNRLPFSAPEGHDDDDPLVDGTPPDDEHDPFDAEAAVLETLADELPDEVIPAAPVRATGAGGAAAAGDSIPEEQLTTWIAGVVERDNRALCALYDATVSRVHGLALRIVRRPALAEEVVEDTYFQVWRQAVRFDATRGRALTWLLGMARSRAIDAIRREARFQHDSLDPESPAAEGSDGAMASDDLLDVARGHAELHRALMLLNAQPRQLVAMAFFRGLSHEEIASQTALPMGTVKSQIRRALITLRQVLGDHGLHALAS